MRESKSTPPSWKYPTSHPATAPGAIRPREFLAPAGKAHAAPGPLKAEHFVAYARQVWNHDRGLAARHLFEALRLDPRHPWANHGLADYFFEAGMLPEALDHSARAVEAAPDDVDLAALRLLVLDAHGMADQAMALLSRHFEAGRSTPELVMMFARLAPRTKQESQAIGRIEHALAVSSVLPPQRKALHMLAASLLDRLGRYDDALEHAHPGH